MEISASVSVGSGMSHIAHVETTTFASEVSAGVHRVEELLPADVDAMQKRAEDAVAEIRTKILAEIERYRPAAMARAERLAHEKAAAGSEAVA